MSVRTFSMALAAMAALTAMAPVAEARDGIGPGGAAALGVIGGLAVGTAIGAGAANAGGYYPGRPVAVAPAYGPPPPARVYVEEECYFRKRRFYDDFGNMIVRRERVCE